MPAISQSSLTHCHQLMSLAPAATNAGFAVANRSNMARYCAPPPAIFAAILVRPGESFGPSMNGKPAKSPIGRGPAGAAGAAAPAGLSCARAAHGTTAADAA